MCRAELVDFHASVEAKQTANFGFGERAAAVAFEGKGFERGAGGILAGGGELYGVGVRDFEGHLHGVTIAVLGFWGGVEEGNFVVTAAPALRPAAAWKRLWRGCYGRVGNPALPEFGGGAWRWAGAVRFANARSSHEAAMNGTPSSTDQRRRALISFHHS